MPKRLGTAATGTEDAQLVDFLKALAHPKRFKMVEALSKSGELSCGELASKFELSQATISHHLKLLVDAGVVIMRQDGQHHFLSVNQAQLTEVASLLKLRLDSSQSMKPKHPNARGRAEP